MRFRPIQAVAERFFEFAFARGGFLAGERFDQPLLGAGANSRATLVSTSTPSRRFSR